jgi:hypothetical protein
MPDAETSTAGRGSRLASVRANKLVPSNRLATSSRL